jgi:hypothetical protein
MALATLTVLALWVARPDTTPGAQVDADLASVADPTLPESTTTTTCVPESTNQSNTQLTPADGDFDPATVAGLTDPGELTCGTQTDLLVVGDSTGRGISNGLAALQDPNLRIWDRTTLGCSLGDEECPDFRVAWAQAAAEVDPDVAVLYFNPSDDIQGVDDADFLSPEGRAQREVALREAATAVSSQGAAPVFVAVPPPIGPQGYFYCDGRSSDSRCDPDWVAEWNDTVTTVANEFGAPVLNVAGYTKNLDDEKAARPDGVHFAGDALVNLAKWSRPLFKMADYQNTRNAAADDQGENDADESAKGGPD